MKCTLEGSNSAEGISPWDGEDDCTVANMEEGAGGAVTFLSIILKF